ncbi:hypothetical protein [Herbaspirillum lusitanum]|uniref:hypothetical protein n=1 Tax=Herbaspirillum lusitanum TaxID=213312 RepID=UPI00223749B6|nr:hypothetical protein [Herbaspirillum lusitanum]
MKDDIALACPQCQMPVIRIASSSRPIQEQKLTCRVCGKISKIAALTTENGEAFQRYLRKIDPRANIEIYSYKR